MTLRLPPHKAALYLTHNDHKGIYQSLAEWIEDHSQEDGGKPFISPEEEAKCLETDELWELQWYPNTPVGFFMGWASTLEALLAWANDPEATQ